MNRRSSASGGFFPAHHRAPDNDAVLLRTLVAPFRLLFAFGQLAMVAAAGGRLVFPWAVRGVFGSLLASRDITSLFLTVAGLACVLVLTEVAAYAQRRLLGTLGEKVIQRLRDNVYDKLLGRSISFYRNTVSGDLVSAVSNDIAAVRYGIVSGITGLVQQSVTLLVVVVMLFLIDPVLATAVLLFVPAVLLIARHMSRRVERTATRRQTILGEIMSVFQQSIAGIEVIRSFLLEREALRMYRDRSERSLRVSVEAVGIDSLSTFASGLAGSLLLAAVMGFGGYRVLSGALSPADLIAFILYSEMITGPFVALSTILPETAKARASYRRLEKILDDPVPDDQVSPRFAAAESPRSGRLSAHTGSPTPSVSGSVEFDSVRFSYDGNREVLVDVSFRVEPGETLALVGPSGAGKSTVFRLVTRLHELQEGSIRIGGREIRDIDVEDLRLSVGIVPQDSFLFDMSIADNIACGKVSAARAEIERVARLAHVDEFAATLEHGLDTEVGDDGSRLSGGQRQRVAIARAFLKDPPILLLDEATSALDGRSERLVREALGKLRKGRTTLVVAHRPETFREADRIVLIEAGRVVATGTHAGLLRANVLYRELFKAELDRGRETT